MSPWVGQQACPARGSKAITLQSRLRLPMATGNTGTVGTHDSTGDAGSTMATLLVKQYEENWFIAQISEVHLPPASNLIFTS